MDYKQEIGNLKIQLTNLQNAFIESQKNQSPIIQRTDESHNKIPQINSNTTGVEENDTAICDIAELSDVNSMAIDDLAEMADTNSLAIDDLAEMIDDLEQRVEALEGKNE